MTAMNWVIVTLVFHVLRLNLCVAYNQVCPNGQYLNASGICIDCTVCKQPDRNIVLRPCSSKVDTLCGSISDIKSNVPVLSKNKLKNKIDLAAKFLDINAQAELSKDSISQILSKSLKTSKNEKTNPSDYYEDDVDDDDDDYGEDEYNEGIKTHNSKVKNSGLDLIKKPKKTIATEDSLLLDVSSDLTKNGKQIKKDLNINATNKSFKYSVFPKMFKYPNQEISSTDPLKKKPKDTKKSKKKASDVTNLLKIGDTKFVINDVKHNEDDRWLHLSQPHIVDQKIYVDFESNPPLKDKKASTFFSSSEKSDNYGHEMTKLLNETSSIFNGKLNQTKPDEDYDNILPKNLDDDDDDDEDSDEDEDDDDKDDDEDEDDLDDDDYNLIYNDAVNRSASDSGNSMEKFDSDLDDEYDLLDTENGDEKKWYQAEVNDIIAEPFASTANWQILILVSAMSACLLFFIVVSTYICLYMRKRRQFKTTFEADVEDLSVRVNLMQHAGFEADDTSNIKNYITQLKGVKSNNEKLPKMSTRKK